MTLRLVLVSLVAALGITVPTRHVFDEWVASTQSWMNARLADWDRPIPSDSDYVIVDDLIVRESVANRLDAPKAPGSSRKPVAMKHPFGFALTTSPLEKPSKPNLQTARKVSYEPIVLSGNLLTGIAYELNRCNEGIGIVPPAVVARKPAPSLEGLHKCPALYFSESFNPEDVRLAARSGKNKPVFEPIELGAELSTGVADELNLRNEGIGITPPAVGARKLAQSSFDSMESSGWLYFADAVAPEAEVGGLAIRSGGRASVATPLFEPIEISSELYVGVAYELNRRNEGIGIVPPASPTRHVATKSFVPMDPGAELEAGIAYELNRANEGILPTRNVFTTMTRATSPPPATGPELNRAVRLTREAVFAWVHVFTGPALVTVSHSSQDLVTK